MKILTYIAAFCLVQTPLCFAVTAESTPAVQKPATTDIKYDLKEDGRKWKIGNQIQNDALVIIQYVPEETPKDDTQEVITVMEIHGVNADIKDYYKSFVQQLANNTSGLKVSHKMIKEEDKAIFGEWWIDENSPEDQHEWFKLFQNGDRLYILRYTTNDKKNLSTIRPKWEKIIDSAKIMPSKAQESTNTSTEAK